VYTVELELEMKEWKEENEKHERLKKMLEQQPALQVSPTVGIHVQLNNARIGTPALAPTCWPPMAPGAYPFQGTGSGGPGNLFAARKHHTRRKHCMQCTSPWHHKRRTSPRHKLQR
jgi:hypothetical protein